MVTADYDTMLEEMEKKAPGAGARSEPVSFDKAFKVIRGNVWQRFKRWIRSSRKSSTR